jgi:hypothetical protein
MVVPMMPDDKISAGVLSGSLLENMPKEEEDDSKNGNQNTSAVVPAT